jgi:hypothetical protein
MTETVWSGPFHVVRARVEREIWLVNGEPTVVRQGDVVAFVLTDAARIYTDTGRADDLGVLDADDLTTCIVEETSKTGRAKAKKKAA